MQVADEKGYSLTMANNKEFKVGDGVNYSYATDTHPGTVIKVTPTRVTVAKCKYECTEELSTKIRAAGGLAGSEYRLSEGLEGLSFKDTESTLVFTERKDGSFRMVGATNWGTLYHGRSYYYDPSF